MTADDPWASAWTPPPARELTDYEKALEAAGYGSDDRARFLAEYGTHPEYAAHVWDGEIIPAAEAAGAIPRRTVPEDEMSEAVRRWCERAAIRQHDANRRERGERVGLAVTAGEVDDIRQLSERLVHQHGAALADLLRSTPRPRWVKDNPAAQQAVAQFEQDIFALLAS
ncbi:hypothetical protein ACWCQL_13320 [Streptomyces sp. NPDC002073]